MAVPQINSAEHLLNMYIIFPESSNFFNVAPANISPVNHSQDTIIQVAVNSIFSCPL